MPVASIGDLGDPRLDDFTRRTDVDLRAGGKTRGSSLYVAESLIVLERALRAGHQPRAALAVDSSVDAVVALLLEHGAVDIPVFTGPEDVLAGLTGYALHRGVVASLHRPEQPTLSAVLAGDTVLAGTAHSARRLVIIENVADPTNVGAIFRSVAGIGADAVLVTESCADPFYRRAIRVSMGTVLQVPWTRAPGWDALGPALHAAGFATVALALTPEAVSLRSYAATAPDRVALVLGNEAAGLSAEALAAADVHVQVPMRHGVDSLNVAAAAAVAIYALTD